MGQLARGGLQSDQQAYQHCFIGHSHGAPWRKTFEEVCEEVLPECGLKPWYADNYYQGNVPLRQKVVNMVATTRYGIYDLSSWRKDDHSPWLLPRNVLIELGMAIALNRPMLLLRHGRNRECGIALPACLEGIEIGEFGNGKKLLTQTLRSHLPLLTQHTPKQDWLNRYCHFGGLECAYREIHPQVQRWEQKKIHIHIADGTNATHIDCSEFHDMIEEDVLSRFSNLEFAYLDSNAVPQGRKFLLCSRCQQVRSSLFALYRITPDTSADTFIAIGMSIALEKQFGYAITKILITDDAETIPSLLQGYEIIVEQNYVRIKDRLNAILPQIIEEMKQTTWRPQALPFEVFLPEKKIAMTNVIVEQEEEAINPLDEEPAIDSSLGSARFVLLSDTGKAFAEYPLDKEEITIGRAPSCDILLRRDKLTSRRHATVRYENGQYTLYDERSSNGIFVNGIQIEELTPTILRHGDHVGIGEHELVFHSFPSVIDDNDTKIVMRRQIHIFISYAQYAQRDKSLMDRLRIHLVALQRQSDIVFLYDSDLRAVENGHNVIESYLNTADLILLLVSADFLASDSSREEMQHAMERHRAGRATVVPILLRPVDFTGFPLNELPVILPKNKKPVTRWPNQDEAFTDIVRGIREVIEDLREK